MKNCQKLAENAKINAVLSTHKHLLVSDKNIGIQDRLKNFSDSLCDKEHIDAQYLQIAVIMG